MEAHLLGTRHQPRHSEPALAIRDPCDRLAAERETGAEEAVNGVRGQAGAVKAAVRCAWVDTPDDPANVRAMNLDLIPIFETLRSFYVVHAGKGVVVRDDASRYFIGTHEVRAHDGYRTSFGGVEIKKAYVSAHLMPVYIYPSLLSGISTDLKNRMQGKSCFNFRKLDTKLFDELDDLIRAGVSKFEADGRF